MTEKKKRSPRFKMLSEVDQFVSSLMKSTNLNKNEVIESLLYMHMVQHRIQGAHFYGYNVTETNGYIKQQKD